MMRPFHRFVTSWSLNRVLIELAATRDYLFEIEEDYAQLGFSCDCIVAEILESRAKLKALEEECDYLRKRLSELS